MEKCFKSNAEVYKILCMCKTGLTGDVCNLIMSKLYASTSSLWRNRLARSAVNRKVGGSSPPRDEIFCPFYSLFEFSELFSFRMMKLSISLIVLFVLLVRSRKIK